MDNHNLQRLGEGERLLADLVREHHRRLVALARTLVGDSDAGELAHNAWLEAHQGISRFEGRSRIRTWLGSGIYNNHFNGKFVGERG